MPSLNFHLERFTNNIPQELIEDFRQVAELSLTLRENVTISVDISGEDVNVRNWVT